jgi:hypothetical protein
MQKILLISLSVLLLIPNFFNKDLIPPLSYDQKEKFDPSMMRLDNIQSLEAYTDSLAAAKGVKTDSYEYLEVLVDVIKHRFYHGFSHFTLNENWIAALSGAYIKEDYSCKVSPETIIQHGNAACSQQAIVMMAILRNKNFTYRSLGFPHHYAMEIAVDKEWYFFDANMEPVMQKEQRRLSAWQHNNDQLKKYYDLNRFNDLDYKFGTGLPALVGEINEVPARNARLFYLGTGIMSKTAWLLPLLLIFFKLKLDIKSRIPRFSIQRKRMGFNFAG